MHPAHPATLRGALETSGKIICDKRRCGRGNQTRRPLAQMPKPLRHYFFLAILAFSASA
jgi:hypothetical protein